MIELNTKNLNKIGKICGISAGEISTQSKNLPKFLKKIAKRNQGFYSDLTDKKTVTEIKRFAAKSKTAHIIVLGIGGSALGAICLRDSFSHLFKQRKLHVLDNIDPTLIQELEDIIDYKKTLFIVITKSGTTPETMGQYFYFRKKLEDRKLKPQKHMVFITNPEKGRLREIANKEKFKTFDIPKNIGGRFSVLTPAGLLPAALLGINIEKLLKGAKTMSKKFLDSKPKENLPFRLALVQYLLSKKGKNITVMMPYAQKLLTLSDWYRQLLAESIGKSPTVGLTPVKALGVTDQHSQLQLYNNGPNNKLIIFIEVGKLAPPILVHQNIHPKKKLTFNKLIQIEKESTEKSLTKNNRPNITIKIPGISEESLGELFMLFMGEVAFLGEFFKVNAFDQPGVELSKKLTKSQILKL